MTLSVFAQSSSAKKQISYKFWVECSGNNHNLIKQIIKRRPWIYLASEYNPDAIPCKKLDAIEDD